MDEQSGESKEEAVMGEGTCLCGRMVNALGRHVQ